MSDSSVRRFYDDLARDYHLIFADWDASMARQAVALDTLVRQRLGAGPRRVLDCSCGIGTQAIGLARAGHRVVGGDLSAVAVARATAEATARGVELPVVAADMRQLPFPDAGFDVVVCADNSLPHLLCAQDVIAALRDMRRVLRDGGLLVLTVRPYDELLAALPPAPPPQIAETPEGRVVTLQLWHWHEDGEHYDLEHLQLLPAGDTWTVRTRRTTYWALTRARLTRFVAEAGFTEAEWRAPDSTGFYQPVLTALRASR
ncbi:class I SAM-dependent methyltransferase [Streptomyces sp. S3(2020)]|uniref:class I SAM-dependent methyltransferase n=1 Tax=Streptomyces sp. S3(2020) TaxID=2732044 RepID=UPI001488EA0B|nr:class I SAM-dependent methyltransferase [Streptomyces sp. S3(2020)]NNN32338.1 class I SAM-dependent methyltransferase [Streptomyces sp. S3(2020)]